MQHNEKHIKKKIYADCRMAMQIPLSFHIFGECFPHLVIVYTASVLGTFANAVFNHDLSYALSNIWTLLLCIALTVFVLPMLSLVGNILMLKYALLHDRMVFGRFLDKEYSKVLELDAGEMQYRLENDPCSLRIYWVDIICKLVMIPITFTYLLYKAAQISWLLTLIMLGASVIKLAVPMAVQKIQAKYDAEIREYNTILRAYETEITCKPYIVKLFGLKKPFIKRFDKIYQENFKNTESKDIACKTFTEHTSLFLDTFCTLIILLFGAVLAAKGSITPGAVAAMVGYLNVTYSLLNDTGEIIKGFPIMKNIASRMVIFYSDKEELSGESVENPSELSVKGLVFSYDEKEVFSNVSFAVQKGDKVAICGKNGSGKSTLLKVFCGLLKDYKGSLILNGKALSGYAIGEWRKQIAYAQQDPYLFSGSVKDNIRFGNLAASNKRIEELLEILNICYLSEKQISMKAELSGGEKQKISIARALLKDTPILILDEPTNHLDEQSLSWLRSFIKRTNKTVLFVSHQDKLSDLATVKVTM